MQGRAIQELRAPRGGPSCISGHFSSLCPAFPGLFHSWSPRLLLSCVPVTISGTSLLRHVGFSLQAPRRRGAGRWIPAPLTAAHPPLPTTTAGLSGERARRGTPQNGPRLRLGLCFLALTRLPLAPRTAERGRSSAVMGAGLHRPAPHRRGAQQKLAPEQESTERKERGDVLRHEQRWQRRERRTLGTEGAWDSER
ncbi:hypothetical protein BJ982_004891 [Sphaerisporangium siamense]|uniref:Uncharacterized protein n=1 Tax=Sphaerisporangium siamense TaxID=795645 RepID=A0A7W7DAL9_9ACTN|nr:hypothetical protein [Sphaerisporangium siamense]